MSSQRILDEFHRRKREETDACGGSDPTKAILGADDFDDLKLAIYQLYGQPMTVDQFGEYCSTDFIEFEGVGINRSASVRRGMMFSGVPI